MPSTTHEALIALFRDRPELAPTLVRDSLHVALPDWSSVEVREANLTELSPTEYRADLVLLLKDDQPVFGIVLEVQLSDDGDKRYSWPVYATGLRARWRCPCAVLVIALSRDVARWAGVAIDLGSPGCLFTPLVLGPDGVPWVSSPDPSAPELAILSALAHRNEPGGTETVLAALRAAEGLDEERAALYYDLVVSGLSHATRTALEALMNTQKHNYQSDFARKYFSMGLAEGEAKGKRVSLLTVLDARGVNLTPIERALIDGTSDITLLETWFVRALRAATAADVFGSDET